MEALEKRQELHAFIDIGDSQFLDALYKTAKDYIQQRKKDRMIAEADINAGNIYSLAEARKIVDHWDVK